jgi:uncharacterized protein
VASGKVTNFELITNNAAFDVGGFDVGGDHHLTFVNEYMTVERGDERVATFPSAITTLSPKTGFPVSVAQLRDGLEDEVLVLVVDKSKVPLGDGVLEPSAYVEVEAMLGGKPLAEYLGDAAIV